MAAFRFDEALKRTVLPALTLIGSPVLGFTPLRAFVFLTVKVPKLGRVKPPVFLISFTMASIRSAAARFAATPVISVEFWITSAMKALESVRDHLLILHSLLSINLTDAQRKNARAFRFRHSQSLASRRQRLSQAMVRSTTQRLGSTAKALAASERLTISTFIFRMMRLKA